MSAFCKKAMEYMYNTKLDQFVSSFHELYSKYNHLDSEDFVREWFDRSVIRCMIDFFPLSHLIKSYEEIGKLKRKLFSTYVKTYWDFCKNPKKHPARIEEAIRFFNLQKLEEKELKKKYRELAKQFHPDISGKTKSTHVTMVKINYYYQILRRYLVDRCSHNI